jgi:hypothetical protein
MTVESKPAADASIGQLMSDLSAQTSRLVRDELRLAQKEFQESAKHAGIAAGVAALSLVLPVWAAALIVGVILFIAAGIAALVGRGQVREATPAAPRTAETVKADIQEIKDARHG